ncbi:hypothetical protein PXK00_04175 [Phaeobacter sp. QD34_3]|uniref:hypothetical protein n=1 Tax=unclassified Phaeobacter TaxID=2621772 RepID=UPI00237F4FA5|nr:MULTISPECIES: hypothetical protein [unclassified Phaeobacter]MDE4132294.1 hypothetical protein [Phaeobacter sp. QD34_3]MDE4135932.1 hypothetical protein [Phaeobacter sp. QD34_24]
MSLIAFPRNQHRKFIALILSLSLALTGVSAAPARADEDVAKFIAGMALLGILGAAINDARHDNQHGHVAPPPQHPPHHPRPHPPTVHPRPLPPHVARYDLPAQCVRYFPRYSKSHTLVGQTCLQRHYRFESSLPQACRVTFWNGQVHRSGYKPSCLQNRGYRIVRK